MTKLALLDFRKYNGLKGVVKKKVPASIDSPRPLCAHAADPSKGGCSCSRDAGPAESSAGLDGFAILQLQAIAFELKFTRCGSIGSVQ